MKDTKFSLYPFSSRKLTLHFFIPRYVALEKPHLLNATIFPYSQQPKLMDNINAFNANPKFILIFLLFLVIICLHRSHWILTIYSFLIPSFCESFFTYGVVVMVLLRIIWLKSSYSIFPRLSCIYLRITIVINGAVIYVFSIFESISRCSDFFTRVPLY